MSATPTRGPWRALCFALLALVLVQADAHSLPQALDDFARERVLPAARWLRADLAPHLAALRERLPGASSASEATEADDPEAAANPHAAAGSADEPRVGKLPAPREPAGDPQPVGIFL